MLEESEKISYSHLDAVSIDDLGDGTYDFYGMVNHKFYGLTNFILGNYHSKIEIIEPESLVIHLRETVKNMGFWEEK